jgi:hypothetical protein
MKQVERGAKDCKKDKNSESDDTTSTYISRQFGLEKTDECSTWTYQFTGDKTADRQNLFTSWT